MKYAVIRTGGKQYRVTKGDVLDIERLPEVGKTITFDDVLLVADGAKVKVGNPFVKGAKVKAKVLEAEKRGEKLNIMRFRAKSRYRRRLGHRQSLTQVEITGVTTS